MSHVARFWGMGRSIAVYHLIPFRQMRLRRLYRGFVHPGDLVFDVGAHVGNRVRAFVALGCRVVAVEPQPDFAWLLRRMFRGAGVTVVEAAVAGRSGRTVLSLSDRTPTVSTTDEGWRDARSRETGFDGVRWNRRLRVEATSLDALIDRFGVPAFVKLDVEGAEAEALGGLTRPVSALSFEFLPGALEIAGRSAARLAALGDYRFNWSTGESYRLAEPGWLTDSQLLAVLDRLASSRTSRSGDVYARLTPLI